MQGEGGRGRKQTEGRMARKSKNRRVSLGEEGENHSAVLLWHGGQCSKRWRMRSAIAIPAKGELPCHSVYPCFSFALPSECYLKTNGGNG